MTTYFSITFFCLELKGFFALGFIRRHNNIITISKFQFLFISEHVCA